MTGCKQKLKCQKLAIGTAVHLHGVVVLLFTNICESFSYFYGQSIKQIVVENFHF